MESELFAPFLEATRSVFMLMFDLSDADDSSKEQAARTDGIAVSIGVTGDLTGEVIYRFPTDTSLNMVKILSGMEVDTVDDFVTSAVSEIANIISGNVLMIFEGNKVLCDILPPILTTDPPDTGITGNACCIQTSAGEVCLDIRVKPTE